MAISSTSYKPGQSGNELWTEADAVRLGTAMLAWFEEDIMNVFFDEFLLTVVNEADYPGKIGKWTPSYLSKKYEAFKELHQKCKAIEEMKLKSLSFKKIGSEGMAKFLLSAQYGYTEKTEQTFNTSLRILNVDPLASDDIEEDDE